MGTVKPHTRKTRSGKTTTVRQHQRKNPGGNARDNAPTGKKAGPPPAKLLPSIRAALSRRNRAKSQRRDAPPRMTYWNWFTTQRVQIGGTAVNEWYWRCPVCRRWGGPYPDASAAKRVAMDHRYYAHDRRSRTDQ